MADERDRAKGIILEISKKHSWFTRTELHCVFYLSHLYYDQLQPDFLSLWPMIKGPLCPEISECSALLAELVADGHLEPVPGGNIGPFPRTLHIFNSNPWDAELRPSDREAIDKAIAFMSVLPSAPHTAIQEHSFSWQEAEPGDELNIHLDIMPDHERDVERQKVMELAKYLEDSLDNKGELRG